MPFMRNAFLSDKGLMAEWLGTALQKLLSGSSPLQTSHCMQLPL